MKIRAVRFTQYDEDKWVLLENLRLVYLVGTQRYVPSLNDEWLETTEGIVIIRGWDLEAKQIVHREFCFIDSKHLMYRE